MTREVRIVAHLLSWYVRSRYALVVFHRLQSSYHSLIQDAFKEQSRSFRKFHLSINIAKRVEVVFKSSSANE